MEGRTDELREEALWALDQETVVRRLYEAFAAWDMEPVAGLLSVDVRLSRAGDPGNAGDHRGSVFLTDQHVVQPEAQRAFRQVRCLPQECEHLLVAVVATYRATHPDQSPLENNLVHLIRAGDGRVSESWFHSRIQYEVDEFWVP